MENLRRFLPLVASFLFLVGALLRAQTSVWTGGGGSTDWLSSGNWNNGVPGSSVTSAELNAGSVQLEGADVSLAALKIGAAAGGAGVNGSLILGSGTLGVTGAGEVNIGSGAGNSGSLTIGTGTLNVGSASAPTTRVDLVVGAFGATGSVIQSGGSVVLGSTGGLFHIGNQGTGTYTLQSGSITLKNAMALGRSNSYGLGNGTFNISGGSLTLSSATKGALLIGGVDGSGAVSGGTGVVNQTGGTVTVGQYIEFGPHGGTGTYNLSGGTLQVGGTNGIRGGDAGTTAIFNLGGGTLQVAGSNLTTSVSANLVAGTRSTIDTNGLNAALGGNLVSAGLHQIDFGGSALVKAGAGTLTLSGASRVLDTFATVQGTTRQSAGSTSAVELMAGTGAGSTAAFQMDGGTLTIKNSTRADNTTVVAGSFRVGDFGGVGTFTQTAGTVTVNDNGALNIGNQGGSGTYNLQGGSLVLNNGLHVIGRSDTVRPASQGVLNISGGTMQVQNSGSLFLGTNVTNANSGFSATLNQTGGTLHFAAGTNLYLSAFSTGTYNLSGGTLEIGGNTLKPTYNGHGDGGTFNLGGGTIKVTGSSLNTTVKATLVAGTDSTINTNGFGGTWSGVLSGQGSLTKAGAGTLLLSGGNTYSGGTTIRGGTLRMGGDNALGSGDITFGGGTLDLNDYNLSAGQLAVSSNSYIDFAGISTLLFADSADIAGSWNGVLTLLNFDSNDTFKVGSDGNGLTQEQLLMIHIGGFYARIDANGFVSASTVAVPEPATCAALVGAAVLGFALRRRLRFVA